MSDAVFTHDVFLSHSAKDKAVVRPLAERLRADGLKVWFDDWEIKPGDSIPAKIEEGLEHSLVPVLCMSGQAFGADWAQLEAARSGLPTRRTKSAASFPGGSRPPRSRAPWRNSFTFASSGEP